MTKKKDIYALLNEVEVDSDNYDLVEISEFEKQDMLRQFRRSNQTNKKWSKHKSHPIRNAFLIIAAIASFFLFQPTMTRQITARVVNFLQDVQMSLSESLFGANDSVDNFFEVAEAKTIGDIPVKLQDIYITENTLTYNILFHYPQADENWKNLAFGEENIFINGEQIELIPSELIMGFVPDQEEVYHFTHTYYLPQNLNLNGEINFALELKNLHYIGQDDNLTRNISQDEVIFEVITSGEKLLADTNTIETDAVISTDFALFTFEEIALNPGYSRILTRAKTVDPDPVRFNDHTYKLRIQTENGELAYFTRSNSPGLQEDGTQLMELRFDEMNSEISLTKLLESPTLDLQLMRFEGLKAAVEEFEEVGNPITIEID